MGELREPLEHADPPAGSTSTPAALHASSPSELKRRIEAERRAIPFLVYRDEQGAQQLVSLSGGVERLTIGRSESNDVALAWDPEVSRLHAELERLADQWTVSDDQLSSNGTYVNGARIGGRRRLRDGDLLRLGRTSLLFRAPRETDSRATLAALEAMAAPSLSEAQRRVLIALCRPLKDSTGFAGPATNAEIAEELVLSVAAVKSHLRVMFQKFAIEDLPHNRKRSRLVELAFQSGIVSERDL